MIGGQDFARQVAGVEGVPGGGRGMNVSRMQVLSPSQIVFSVVEHDVDTVGVHPEDISKPHNPPWTGSLVLESPGPWDGKDQLLLPLLFGVPHRLHLFPTLHGPRLREGIWRLWL